MGGGIHFNRQEGRNVDNDYGEFRKDRDTINANIDDTIRDILKNLGKSRFEIEEFMRNQDRHTDKDGFLVLYDAEQEEVEQLKFE